MAIEKLEERMALSKLDTVYLFAFTLVTVSSTFLSSLIGTLRG